MSGRPFKTQGRRLKMRATTEENLCNNVQYSLR